MATILSIEELPETHDDVYDIETEVGTFSTDTGIILKNTDSCYVKFFVDRTKFESEEDYLEEVFRLSEECADAITKTFKPPIELEFEKVMWPFLLFQKKRYAYREWVRGKNGAIVDMGVDCKGIEYVRRSSCEYVKDVSKSMLDTIMYNHDIEDAKKKAHDGVKKLFDNEVDIKKLVVSNGLSHSYKVDGKSVPWDDPKAARKPHVFLAQELKKLDPMNSPKPPNRVPYVYIQNKKKGALQFEKVAHPDYIGNKKIDALYYFEHQLESPINTIMDVVMDDPSEIYKELVRDKKNKDQGLQSIKSFFKPKQ